MRRALPRTRLAELTAAVAVVAGLAAAVPAFPSDGSPAPGAADSASAAEREPNPSRAPGARVTGQRAPFRGFLIARPRPGRSVFMRSGSGGSEMTRLGPRTEFGSRLTLGVVKRRGEWLGVTSPVLRNGELGWVKASDVLLARTRVSLVLDRSARLLVLKQGRRIVRRMKVGVGRPESPTPMGRFAVTDKLSGPRFGSYYGCCIVALSATQPNLPRGWTGGDRVAIHGTNNPSSIGAASSAGCPRASTADLRVLMRRVPLGAPVFVRA